MTRVAQRVASAMRTRLRGVSAERGRDVLVALGHGFAAAGHPHLELGAHVVYSGRLRRVLWVQVVERTI